MIEVETTYVILEGIRFIEFVNNSRMLITYKDGNTINIYVKSWDNYKKYADEIMLAINHKGENEIQN